MTEEVKEEELKDQKPQPTTAARPQEKPVERPPAPRRRRMGPLGWVILLIVLAAALFGGTLLWGYLQSYEDTDDAQIDGDIYAVTSRINGMIRAVYVEDNQQVKAGQLLVELDPRDYEVAVQQAKAAVSESQSQVETVRPNVPITSVSTETTISTEEADIAGGEAQVAAAQRDYDSAVAQVRQAEADNVKAQADLARYKILIAKDEISQQQYDQVEAVAKAAAALVDARHSNAEANARAIDAQRAKLRQSETRAAEARRNRPHQIEVQNATVKARQATTARQQTVVDQALLNLSYTKVLAPVDGIIGKKSAQAGQQVSAGQQLMADVPLNNLWVTANFKETQLKKMHPGQRVTIHVDAYNRDFEGYVESVAGASGARFSLLPPENATGNYVKVVQRLPVRIRFKEGEDKNHQLRPGMSVEPKVWLDK
ncbi:MAG TPA: HlyD family secretion protein [Bryobacteraceae bacterium]|nr:HlyD family secretion protein [Bryobacteraceae bacterium]